jgi:hypothetical protein
MCYVNWVLVIICLSPTRLQPNAASQPAQPSPNPEQRKGVGRCRLYACVCLSVMSVKTKLVPIFDTIGYTIGVLVGAISGPPHILSLCVNSFLFEFLCVLSNFTTFWGFESPAPPMFWYSLFVESYDRKFWVECRGIRRNAEHATTCHIRFQFGRSRTTRGDRDYWVCKTFSRS